MKASAPGPIWFGVCLFLAAAPCSPEELPRNLLGGYWETELTHGTIAKTFHMIGINPYQDVYPARLEVFYNGVPVGFSLPETEPGLFEIYSPLLFPLPLKVLLELRAITSGSEVELEWPYLTVKDVPPTPTPTSTPTPTFTSTPTPMVCNREMIVITPGSFTMGSPSTEPCRDGDEGLHTVELPRAFAIQNFEVTQGQWNQVFSTNPSAFPDCGDCCPVENMNWFDAVVFCNRWSLQEGLVPCYYREETFNTVFNGTPPVAVAEVYWDHNATGYRLPTEAEWEYTCRAGTATALNSGYRLASNCLTDLNLTLLGWYGNSSGGKTHPVGQRAPNAWGLFDMHGNVWEWCWDYYGAYVDPAVDPAGPDTGSFRCLRGGGYMSFSANCRSGNRGNLIFWPFVESDIGFRIARTLP